MKSLRIAHADLMVAVSSVSANSVKRFFLAPIWLCGSRACSSVVSAMRSGSNIVEFDVPAYPGLYPSFLVFVLKPRSKGLGAFYKQLAATTLTGGFTSSFGYFIMGLAQA